MDSAHWASRRAKVAALSVDGSTPTRSSPRVSRLACLAGPSHACECLGQLGHGREDGDAADLTTFELSRDQLELLERGVGSAFAEQGQGAGVASSEPAELEVGGGGETESLGNVRFASGPVTANRRDERERAVRLRDRERADHDRSEVDRLGPRGVGGVEVALPAEQQRGGAVQRGHVGDGPGLAGRGDGPAVERVRLGDLVGDQQAEQRRGRRDRSVRSP